MFGAAAWDYDYEDNMPSPNTLAGMYVLDILRHIKVPLTDSARAFHDEVEELLVQHRFNVRREAAVSVRASGRGAGRIDLLAHKSGGFVALELDFRSPRPGSMDKLRAFNAFRIIVLRGAEPWGKELGIDAIISVPVLR